MINAQNKIRGFPIALVATPGGQELAEVIDTHLRAIFRENGETCPSSFLRKSENVRFQNGEGKAIVIDSIRGTDLFVVVDVGNHGVLTDRFGQEWPMSPDEHFMDLIRVLGAVKNMAQRVTVVMPLLYESRQHKMKGRESLDCALALRQLVEMGVDTIMTIDAHNSHVMNAIPMHGMENLHASYQLIEGFLNAVGEDIDLAEDLIVVSPDLGGMERARYFAEHFQVHLSAFYKFRDLSRVVDGKNPISEHKFLGGEVKGKTALVIDDMLASGGSMIDVCEELHKRGVGQVYLSVTYALFSSGLERFDRAYEDGLFHRCFGTNGSYVTPELASREWFVPVDVTRFIAKFIHTFNQDNSVTRLLDSTEKINRLLGRQLPGRAPHAAAGKPSKTLSLKTTS